jgi:hypothetical protein
LAVALSGAAETTVGGDQLLESAPTGPDAPGVRYGAGAGIYPGGPFVAVYAHAGRIPGYASSLRCHPPHGVAIAFQSNTDIRLADDPSVVMRAMETGLAGVVMPAARVRNSRR